ncbi:hypothetical protein GW17_00014839 [Ensete ventricosum]|nr:hypothetical protein GW17_00014839 [Ensete ventricosum]
MESPRVKPPPKLGTLARIFNKFFHLRCCVTCSANGAGMVSDEDDYSIHKLKLSQNFSDTSTILSKGIGDFYAIKHEKQQRKLSSKEKEVMESLLANLFVSISAVKAAYAQLQMAIQKLSQHSAIMKYFRVKYLAPVHPKMELCFSGNLDLRAMVSSDQGFPSSAFFAVFTGMARRMWLLHCLFFLFERESDQLIFQVQQESRFSEVYMESVAEGNNNDLGTTRLIPALVGFTVVPGFIMRQMLIQCKVYLSSAASDNNQ